MRIKVSYAQLDDPCMSVAYGMMLVDEVDLGMVLMAKRCIYLRTIIFFHIKMYKRYDYYV
jgi:hypothetical protein